MLLLLRLLLGDADAGRLGRGVDDAGNDVVIHVARLARDALRDGDAFLVRLVREHRPVDDVADGIDARHAGLPVIVDRDAAALGQLHARLVEIEPGRERLAAHGDEHEIGLSRKPSCRPARPATRRPCR